MEGFYQKPKNICIEKIFIFKTLVHLIQDSKFTQGKGLWGQIVVTEEERRSRKCIL